MGYDFTFVCLQPRPDSFPFEPPDMIDKWIQPLRKARELESQIRARGDFRPNGKGYWWDALDGGSLDVCIYENAVYVDTHAHWQHVLDLYSFLCAAEPELLILDNTKVLVHDAESYQRYINDSYSKK